MQAEKLLLHTLGFNFNVEHPYKHLLHLAKRLNQSQDLLEESSRSLTQVAWNFANDRYVHASWNTTRKHVFPTKRTPRVLTEPSHVPRSLRTTLCLQFSASDIANAVLYLGKATYCSKVKPRISRRLCIHTDHSHYMSIRTPDSHTPTQRQSFSKQPLICKKTGGKTITSNNWPATR